jgi:hypothetical protein
MNKLDSASSLIKTKAGGRDPAAFQNSASNQLPAGLPLRRPAVVRRRRHRHRGMPPPPPRPRPPPPPPPNPPSGFGRASFTTSARPSIWCS